MGKKDKAGKKKGPMKILSKCLFFWGKKQNSIKEHEQETSLKRAYSESSVANTVHSKNTFSIDSEHNLDPEGNGECSNSHRHSHFQLYCDTSETEFQNSENVTTDFKAQHSNAKERNIVPDLKNPTQNRTVDLDTSISKSCEGNLNDINVNNSNIQRFTVTTVSDNIDISKMHSTELELIVTPKDEAKHVQKPLLCHPNLNPINTTADDEHYSKSQICQPNLNSISCMNVTAQYSKSQNCDLNLDTTNYTNDASAQISEERVLSLNVGSANFITHVGEKHSDSQRFVSDFGCNNYINDIIADVPEPQNIQYDLNSNHAQDSELQISHHNITSSNDIDVDFVSNIDVQHSESQKSDAVIVQDENSNMEFTNVTVSKPVVEILPSDSDDQYDLEKWSLPKSLTVDSTLSSSNNVIHSSFDQSNSNMDLINVIAHRPVVETLPGNSNDHCDLEKASPPHHPKTSLIVDSTLSSSNNIIHSNFNQTKIMYETTATDKRDSNVDPFIDSDQHKYENELKSQLEMEDPDNHFNRQFSLIASSNVNTQVLDEANKGNELPFQATGQNEHLPSIIKSDRECLKNKNQLQLVENYPSINVIKGTSEIGMTLVVLPYINPTKDRENWNALSNLTTKENNQLSDIDKDSEIVCSEQKQVSISQTKLATREGQVTIRRSNISPNPVKHSRVPVRKSIGSERIVDRISELSTEIEEISNNIKQNSICNRSRLNSANRSMSKIPRRCVSDSFYSK